MYLQTIPLKYLSFNFESCLFNSSQILADFSAFSNIKNVNIFQSEIVQYRPAINHLWSHISGLKNGKFVFEFLLHSL